MRNPLYSYEHEALPRWIFSDPKKLADSFMSDLSKTYYEGLKSVYESDGIDCPYRQEDCKGFIQEEDDNIVIICLQGLDPSEETLCLNMYFFYDLKTNKCAYYCSEIGFNVLDGNVSYHLCEWNKNHRHSNYGTVIPMEFFQQLMYEMRFFYTLFIEEKTQLPLILSDSKLADNVNSFSYICPDCNTETKYDVKWINKNLATCFVCKKCGKIHINKALI